MPSPTVKSPEKESNKSRRKVVNLPLLLFRGLLLGLFLIACLMGAVAGVMMMTDLSLSSIDAAGIVAIIASTMTASCWVSGEYRRNGLLLGLGVGLGVYAVLFLLSLACGFEVGLLALTKLVICLCSGGIGGIMGVNARRVKKSS